MLGAWSCQNCFVLFSILSCVGGFLDLDELSSINYGIDFASEPILLSQEPLPPGTVQLSTKHGQLYQCSFPNIQEEEQKEKEEEKVAMDTGILELLKPMETAPCLVHTKDWWSYEFCYKKHIRQYHLEDGKIQGNVMYLGMYERDYDWSNVTEAMAKSNEHRLNRYHTQQYTNGTVCDLTEKLRRTEVRFQCEEGHSDYVNRVDEPETCVYILTVHTSKVCHHPFLKPPSAHKPVPISCSPVVTEEQYQMYIEEKQESEKKSLERRAHEANILKFLDTANPAVTANDAVETKVAETSIDTESEASSDKVKDEEDEEEDVEDQEDESAAAAAEDEADKSQEARDADEAGLDVKDADQSWDEAATTLSKLMLNTFAESLSQLQKQLEDAGDKEEEDEDDDDNGDDEENVSDSAEKDDVGKKSSSSSSSSILDKNKMQMQLDLKLIKDPVKLRKHINKLLVEKQKELGRRLAQLKEGTTDKGKLEGEEDVPKTEKNPLVTDSTKASESKDAQDEEREEEEDKEILDEFDKGIKDMDLSEEQKAHAVKHKENIAHAVTAKIEDIIQEAEEEVARDEGEPVQLNRGATFKKLAKTLSTLLTKMEEKEKELKDMDENIDSSEKTDHIDATDLDKRKNKQPVAKSEKTDHRIKVRVTRGAKAQARARSTQSSLKIPQSQKSKLEDKVRDELQQAGMDVQGRNIQVKIVTAGYRGDDEETIHVLSEEESASFNQMILTLLGGDAEANKQAQKQTNMENNYNKVWSDKQQKKKTET